MPETTPKEHLEKCLETHPQLSHASNILKKLKSDLKDVEQKAIQEILPRYDRYLKDMLAIKGTDKDAVVDRVDHLNTYYDFIHANGYDNVFSAQGKFRPTILEEFLFLLFKNYVESKTVSLKNGDKLASGNVKAYSNLFISASNFDSFVEAPSMGVNRKDQDYAIYRKITLKLEGKQVSIKVPALAIEAKTYIDKTMLDSIIATAEKVKSGNPHARFVAVAERYDVSLEVDPSYSRIDQIYILRKDVKKGEWKQIDPNVVWRLYSESTHHLAKDWTNIGHTLKNDGIII